MKKNNKKKYITAKQLKAETKQLLVLAVNQSALYFTSLVSRKLKTTVIK